MAELLLYSEIGDWGMSARDFIAQCQAVPASEEITLRINSPGGNITEGFAMISEIRRRGNVVASIDGLAASMASLVAIACKHVRMADGAMMMIHRGQWYAQGDAEDLRDAADTLEKFEEAGVRMYAEKTGLSEKRIREMLADETWLTAREAMALGFVDEISEPLSAAAKATAVSAMKALNLTQGLARMDTTASTATDTTAHDCRTHWHSTESDTPDTTQTPDTTAAAADHVTADAAATAPVEPSGEVIVDTSAITSAPAASVEVDGLVARFREQSAALLAAQTEIASAKQRIAELERSTAELSALRQNFDRLKASVGLMPAQVIPAIAPVAPDQDEEFVKAWNAAPTAGERTALSKRDDARFRRLSAAGSLSLSLHKH